MVGFYDKICFSLTSHTLSFSLQVPNDWVQAQREQITEADGFRLYLRSLELRFRLHKNIFGENNSRVKLKCVAHIREVPKAIKESVATIHVPSMDELTNQKLITWRSAGKINCERVLILLAHG